MVITRRNLRISNAKNVHDNGNYCMVCVPARALKRNQENRNDSRNQLLTKLAFKNRNQNYYLCVRVTLLLVNLLPLTGGIHGV